MRTAEEWIPFSWHCSNCGHIVQGYKNPDGDIKVKCSRCHVIMIRRFRSKKRDTIEIYGRLEDQRIEPQ